MPTDPTPPGGRPEPLDPWPLEPGTAAASTVVDTPYDDPGLGADPALDAFVEPYVAPAPVAPSELLQHHVTAVLVAHDGRRWLPRTLAALGAWLGPAEAVWLAIFSSMAGGALALIVALYHGYLRQAGANVWVMLMHWRMAGLRPVPGLTLRDARAPRLAYAVPIAVGVVCTLWRS